MAAWGRVGGVCVRVSQSVKLLVHTFCVVHFFLTQRRVGFVCGVLIPCSRGT